MGGKDADVGVLVNWMKFIEEECMASLCLVEHAGVLI
jgi:hypothetical protein